MSSIRRIQSLGLSVAFAFTLLCTPSAFCKQNAAPAAVPSSHISSADHGVDLGRVAPSLPMEDLQLVLKRAPEQQQALEMLLVRQNQQGDPLFHAWLTPAEFGENFGLTGEDLAGIRQWLEAQGFSIGRVDNDALVIDFSGTAGQVEKAFQVEIHRYRGADGAVRMAAPGEQKVPEAAGKSVLGFTGLNGRSGTADCPLVDPIKAALMHNAEQLNSAQGYSDSKPCALAAGLSISAVSVPYGSTTPVNITISDVGAPPDATATFSVNAPATGSFNHPTCIVGPGGCGVQETFTPTGTLAPGVYRSIQAIFAGTAKRTVTNTETITATPTAAASNVSGALESTVNLSATNTGVAGVAPTGTVTFVVNGTTATGTPSCSSSGAVETCMESYALPSGLTAAGSPYTYTATFATDGVYSASNTASASLTVTVDSTSTAVSANPGSITTAQTTVFTATVSDTTTPAAVPTGAVTFTLGSTTGTQVGSCTLSAGACSSAAVSGATLGAGTDTVYANYAGVTGGFNSSSGSTMVTVTPSGPPNGYITFSSVGHNFGSVPVGTAATSYGIQITNNGTAAYPFMLNFTPANGFTSANNCPASIATGGKCELVFYFTPQSTTAVSTTWSLAAQNGFGYTPSNGGTLTGSGKSQGAVSLTTAGHNFGTQAVGTTSSAYGTELSNSTTSMENLTLGPVPSGAPFTLLTNCKATLAAGASCEIEFTFTPTSTSPVSVVVPLSGTPTTITAGGAALPNGGITLSGN